MSIVLVLIVIDVEFKLAADWVTFSNLPQHHCAYLIPRPRLSVWYYIYVQLGD